MISLRDSLGFLYLARFWRLFVCSPPGCRQNKLMRSRPRPANGPRGEMLKGIQLILCLPHNSWSINLSSFQRCENNGYTFEWSCENNALEISNQRQWMRNESWLWFIIRNDFLFFFSFNIDSDKCWAPREVISTCAAFQLCNSYSSR